jgi:hypothetical protein
VVWFVMLSQLPLRVVETRRPGTAGCALTMVVM